jgi:hypothetical protein
MTLLGGAVATDALVWAHPPRARRQVSASDASAC